MYFSGIIIHLDPVTHFLTGAAISRAGLNRKTALATLTLVLAAEAPDIDIAWWLRSPVAGFGHHRGFTHTFLGAPFVAAATLGVVYLAHRWQAKRKAAAEQRRLELEAQRASTKDDHEPIVRAAQPVRWGLLYGYALIGVLSHILLDFTNSYGIRPFAPFNPRWYSWNIVSIFEVTITGPLLLALIGPWFFGMISGEVGGKKNRFPGRPSAIAALACILLVWWVRDYNHRRAVTLLKNDVYDAQDPSLVFAGPYSLNPFKWLGVVETDNFYESMVVDTLHDEVDPQREAVIRYKPEETQISKAAKGSPLGRFYLDWAKFPYTEADLVSDSEGGGAVVHIHDLRFVYPDSKSSFLGVTITLDKNLHVLSEKMGNR